MTIDASAEAALLDRRSSVTESISSCYSDASLLEQRWEQIPQELVTYRKVRPPCLETGESDLCSLGQAETTDKTTCPSSSSEEAASWELWNTLVESHPSQDTPADSASAASLGTALPRFPAVWSSSGESDPTSEAGCWQTAVEAQTSCGSLPCDTGARSAFHTMPPATSSSFAMQAAQCLSDLHNERFKLSPTGNATSVHWLPRRVPLGRPDSSASSSASTSQEHPFAAPPLPQRSRLRLVGVASSTHSRDAVSQDATVFSPTSTLFDTDSAVPASPAFGSSAGKTLTSPVRGKVSRAGTATTLSEQCWTPVGLRHRADDTYAARKERCDGPGDREGLLSLVDMLSATQPGQKHSQSTQRGPLNHAPAMEGRLPQLSKRTSSLSLTMSTRHRSQSSAGKGSEDTLYEDSETSPHSQVGPSETSTRKVATGTRPPGAPRLEEASEAPRVKIRAAPVGHKSAREAQRELSVSGRRVNRQNKIMVFWRPERLSKTV